MEGWLCAHCYERWSATWLVKGVRAWATCQVCGYWSRLFLTDVKPRVFHVEQ